MLQNPSDTSGNETDGTDPPASPLARLDTMWLHGAGLAGDTWNQLTSGYPRASTPDLPGHGDADPVTPPRVETFAEAMSELVGPSTVLIGHSLGGMVALELAARIPERVKALVLIEAVSTIRDRLSTRMIAGVASGLYKVLPMSWLTYLAGLGEERDTRAELQRQLARLDRHKIRSALEAAAMYDGRTHLISIEVPTLVVVGRKNTATHYGSKLMADTIKDAAFLKLPGGHMLHTDNPRQLRRSIEGFLSRALPT